MPDVLLVTGATGSVGSNVCRMASEAGHQVRALVRPGSETGPLESCGAEPVTGDVTDRSSLSKATAGVDAVIHCAAQIGGTWSRATPAEFEAVNQWGSINQLDVAEEAGVERVVMVLSAILLDRSETVTEESRIVPIREGDSPYISTKRAAFYEGMARAARGSHINFVVPSGVYGPSQYVDRALVPTIFTGTLLLAARGELGRYLSMPISWVLAEDVAAVALGALERGRRGARYLAMGRPTDACSLPAFCNQFLQMAGVDHRVEEVDPADAVNDPEFGSMTKLLRSSYPTPSHDCTATTYELGVEPTSLQRGLRVTLDWLRRNGRMP